VTALPQGRPFPKPGVVLVGGGPGDPELLTVRGYRALMTADVVVTDRLGPRALLAELKATVPVIEVGKTPRSPSTSQEHINSVLIEHALAGSLVVRLKGGDPFVFGRGAEEVLACVAAGVAVEVVPGVSTVTAAAVLAGIPLTHRGVTQQVIVASGHVTPDDPRSTVDWGALAVSNATLVLLMAVENLTPIAASLIAAGRPPATPVATIEDASLPTQQITRMTLQEAATSASRRRLRPPAVVVVGEVVGVLDSTST
jgi:uroporphyrin-III C-methyltransferase